MSNRVVQRIVPPSNSKTNGTSNSTSGALVANGDEPGHNSFNSKMNADHASSVHGSKTLSNPNTKHTTRSSHSKSETAELNSPPTKNSTDVDGTRIAPLFAYNPSQPDLDALPEFEDRLTLAEICRARDAGIVTHELLAVCVQACGYAERYALFLFIRGECFSSTNVYLHEIRVQENIKN